MLADGCFDPLHVGHIAYLREASRLGFLIVQIASDDAIRAKGRESFQSQKERARTVATLRGVGRTVTYGSLAAAIRDEWPDVLAKGRDWIGKLPEDVVAACREVGTVIVYTDTQERTSTERLFQHQSAGVGIPESLYRQFRAHNDHYRAKDQKFYRGDPGDEIDAESKRFYKGDNDRR